MNRARYWSVFSFLCALALNHNLRVVQAEDVHDAGDETCGVNGEGSEGNCQTETVAATETNETDKDDTECEDHFALCNFWAKAGECDSNPKFMLMSCAKSCDSCEVQQNHQPQETRRVAEIEPLDCQDEHELCEVWATKGECQNNPKYMSTSCAKACHSCPGSIPHQTSSNMGVPQMLEKPDEGVSQIMIEKQLKVAEAYMQGLRETTDESFWKPCLNLHAECTAWVSLGECQANPDFMLMQCAPACESCEEIREHKCAIKPGEPVAWESGDLQQMFQRLSQQTDYPVQILSSPSNDGKQDGPWVLILDDVISPEEAKQIIELGEQRGYAESTQVKGINPDGGLTSYASTHRTSYNAWCEKECFEDETVQNVTARLGQITGIAHNFSEYLQLLKYSPGQYYKKHHDYIDLEVDRPQGTRILTLFLYLNSVDEGGETKFNDLDLVVEPKLGRALLWPNVLSEAPQQKDPRTEHEALPVKKGIKYGANSWYHIRDFKTPNSNGCQ